MNKETINLLNTYGLRARLSDFKVRIYQDNKKHRWWDYFKTGKTSYFNGKFYKSYGTYSDIEDLAKSILKS